MTTLYKKDSKGKIRQWSIQVGLMVDSRDAYGIYTSDGLFGGKIKEPTFKRGRPNIQFKTSQLKAEAMMQSAIDKKLRSNYFKSIEEIKDEDVLFMPTGCPSGMIWEEWKDKDHVRYPALASAKLDGSKLYTNWREDRVFANTRSAKEHMNFKHITDALAPFYKAHPNIVLDGEAYNHEYAERFEELQSIFRKQKPTDEQRAQSAEVAKFYIYDAVDLNQPDMTATERQHMMKHLYDTYLKEIDCIVLWSSAIMYSEEEYDAFHEKCMDKGFEGTVLKIIDAPYVQRKSKMVMKRKPKYDCEFLITNVIEGTGTHKGVAATVTIHLGSSVGINDGHRSDLNELDYQDAGFAKGWNHASLKEVLEKKDFYIGKWGTIEYGGLTTYGNLRFPKFKALRLD